MRARGVGTILAVAVAAAACTTPDSLMKLSRERGTENEQDAAAELAEFVTDATNDPGLRCWALRSLSRLERWPVPAIASVGRVLTNTGESAAVRAWAAFALGELRRKEAVPFFVDAIQGQVDAATAYYALEGLGKVIAVILEEPELNEKVVEAMTVLAARQAEFLPDMYDLVNEYVVNLVVLAVTMERIVGTGEDAAAPQRAPDEVYAAVYRALIHLAAAKEKYLAAFARHGQGVKRVIDLSFSAGQRDYRPLWLLLGWYSGVLGDNSELAALCASHLAAWAQDADPRLRFLVAWSLSRMELHSTEANRELVASVLAAEQDDRVLRVLGEMSREAGKPDKLQQILRVRTQAGEAR